MTRQSIVAGLAVLVLATTAPAAPTVTLTLQSSQDGRPVSSGTTIDWTITAQVSADDNLGLALILADLVQDSVNPELIDLPPADAPPAEMLGFALPNGVTNPAGYEGTQVGSTGAKNLAQIGGAQNTFGVPGPPGVAQDVVLDTGIGQSPEGQVIATGSFTAPTTPGTYVVSLAGPIANTLVEISAPPEPSTAERATAMVEPGNGSISFIVTGSCPGDLNGDGFRNVTDFTLFAAAYGSQIGDPNYNPAADFDGDGFINITDFTIFAGYYLVPCP